MNYNPELIYDEVREWMHTVAMNDLNIERNDAYKWVDGILSQLDEDDIDSIHFNPGRWREEMIERQEEVR